MSDTPRSSQVPQLILAWVIVAVPLLYGLVQTLQNALKLFG